jgi:hypothetical protein
MASPGRRKNRISLFEIILIITALVLIGGGVYLYTGGRESLSRTEVMERRLKDLRELKTVSQTYRSVIYVEEKNFWRGNKQVLFTLEYVVSAGVDFSKGLEIRELPDGVIQVRLPGADILSSDADETTIRQMFLKEQTLLNPVRMGDYMPQIIIQGEANRQAALDGGILKLAEANAQMAVLRILKLGEFENIVFGPALDRMQGEATDG